MSIDIWQVDAFTSEPFGGNPAAVCILKDFPSDDWMQQVAAEMNLSETAFVVPDVAHDSFRLRWFTPVAEVDLCGHATLAAAHTLIETARVTSGSEIRFETRSGALCCDWDSNSIWMNFPQTPIIAPVSKKVEMQVQTALEVETATVMRSKHDIVVIVDDDRIVRQIQPLLDPLKAVETRGVMVTAPATDSEIDFVSRFFAPRLGIDEDPVTGSAHCCLAPYWSERLSKSKLVGLQVSTRGGQVRCELVDDRVRIGGSAITIMSGKLRLDLA